MLTKKHCLAAVLLSLCAVNANAQNLSIEELKKIKSSKIQDFFSVAHKKGFSKNDKTQTSEFVMLDCEKVENENTYALLLTEGTNDDSFNNLQYTTSDKKEFERFKKALLKSGYKEIEKGKISENEIYVTYKLSKSIIKLIKPLKEKHEDKSSYAVVLF